MLVDGGGALNFRSGTDDQAGEFEPDIYRVGEAVVSEVLWERGYSRVDHIVATHADTDHIQGLIDVAKNFEIGAAYFPPAMEPTDETLELRSVLQRRGIRENAIYAGTMLAFGGATVEVLYPERAVNNFGSENDRSLVLMITYNGRRILLTGDIESVAEADLVRNAGQLRADVVKVPHHGSRTSSGEGFIAATLPEIAVVPVGVRSVFGHPHDEVVERWRSAGARVMKTGDRGTITIVTDGTDLVATTFMP
jgi:competence protein ComEC